MLMRKNNSTFEPIWVVLAIVFTIGIVLGAIMLFNIPSEMIEGVRNSLVIYRENDFKLMFWHDFVIEACWIVAIWFLGSINILAPFSAAVVALRGFTTGFSVAFIFTGNDAVWKTIYTYIVPQCVVSLPVMTFCCAVCINLALMRKKGEGADGKYFCMMIASLLLTAIASLSETVLSMVFINM